MTRTLTLPNIDMAYAIRYYHTIAVLKRNRDKKPWVSIASRLGTSAFSEPPKVELRPNRSASEAQVAIRAI